MPSQKRKSKLQAHSSLKVERLVVGQMLTNCYLLYDNKSKEALIIDPGDDAEYIENKINDLGLTPKAIIVTHGHFDHILASEELRLIYKIPLLINQKDEFLLRSAAKSYEYFLKQKRDLSITKPSGYLKDNEIIKLGNDKITVIETSGHTPGSLCLFIKELGIIFTGDTLFAEGYVGRTDFKYSDKKELHESINKISKLGTDIVCYPGHGEQFEI